jgi:hypothetical protein
VTASARRSGLSVVPNTPPAPARRRTVHEDPTVIGQIRLAFRKQNRLATFVGALLGGGVPLASWQLAHREIDASQPFYGQIAAWLVLGGLLFSAVTVYGWSRQAFGSTAKALGYTVLLEGVLITARTSWLSVAALVVLISVNAVATGVKLALAKRG